MVKTRLKMIVCVLVWLDHLKQPLLELALIEFRMEPSCCCFANGDCISICERMLREETCAAKE